MSNERDHPPPPAANTNDDPYASAESALDWLYHHRRELLKIDPETMSFARRRQRKRALEKAAYAEKLLLEAIPPR